MHSVPSKASDEGKAVRLLSCSDLPAAQKLSTYLPDREIYATDDIVAVHTDGGITTVARSGNDTQKWRKLKNGEDIGEVPKPKEPQGEAVEEFVRMGSLFVDAETEDWVNFVIKNWDDDYKQVFNQTLSGPLLDKINKAQMSPYYSKHEKISHEILGWAKDRLFKNNNKAWLNFAQSSSNREHFKTWRYVIFMSKPNPPISISLGSRKADIQKYARSVNSTSFKDFFLRGFISNDRFLEMELWQDWLPLVAKAINKSFKNGGKIYYHLDLIDDVRALYDSSSPFFKGGTITELRYLIDNNLYDLGKVEFRLENNILSGDRLKELEDAIQAYKNSNNKIQGTFTGMFGYKY